MDKYKKDIKPKSASMDKKVNFKMKESKKSGKMKDKKGKC